MGILGENGLTKKKELEFFNINFIIYKIQVNKFKL
jgi:hypothetical protein